MIIKIYIRDCLYNYCRHLFLKSLYSCVNLIVIGCSNILSDEIEKIHEAIM
jgi:hypothetical protein